jgi:hypothetical protein
MTQFYFVGQNRNKIITQKALHTHVHQSIGFTAVRNADAQPLLHSSEMQQNDHGALIVLNVIALIWASNSLDNSLHYHFNKDTVKWDALS